MSIRKWLGESDPRRTLATKKTERISDRMPEKLADRVSAWMSG